MKWIKCIFKGHELTEATKEWDKGNGYRVWNCKRCSFGMLSPETEEYEGLVIHVVEGRNKE